MSNIACIILAAGESTRLGSPKQLIPFNGELLIQNIARKVSSLNVCKTLCITGAENTRVQKALEKYDLKIVYNSYYKNGMSESLMKGIREIMVDVKIDAVLIALCDQPLIPISHYEELLDKFKSGDNSIVCSSYDDTFGVPAVFDRSCFRALLTLDQGGGAKRIIKEFKDQTSFITCKEAALDVDTPEAVNRLLKLEMNSNYSSI